MNNQTVSGRPENKSFFNHMANPVIRRMERKGTFASEECASYKGIAGKTLYFLLVTVVGFLIIGIIHNLNAADAIHVADTERGIFDFSVSGAEGICVALAGIVSIIVPFINLFVRKAIPVVGTVYCAAQGIFIGFISNALADQYKWASMLAVVLTFTLVGAMLFVYAKRIITVTARMKGIVTAAFFAIVLGGIIVVILNFIPGVRNYMTGINALMASPAYGVIFSIIFVIIAAFFLLADFDTIERCVSGRMDKKYEWMAAWGLAYTVLYLYFKILRIILLVLGNSKGSGNKKSF